MTNFFFDNRGKISVVRTSLFFMVIGLLFVFASGLWVAIETESARSPLHIPIPESAEQWGAAETSTARSYQNVYYRVETTDVESVVAHYQQESQNFGSESCKRLPPNGDYPDYDPEVPGFTPYEWKCIFERANVPGVFQTTEVTIQPGVFDEDPAINSEGFTVIHYEQRWQG